MNIFQKTWSTSIIDAVWSKAFMKQGWDPNVYRLDAFGAIIQRSEYGNTDSEANYGWEIDHIVPESRDGSDDLSNLRPLQWMNNRAKADNINGYWKPAVRAVQDGTRWRNEKIT